MNNSYTENAAEAIRLAQKAAQKAGHSHVGTEHLLLGLVLEETGSAGAILREFGVDAGKLAELIDRLANPRGTVITASHEGFTPRAQEVLRYAGEEARSTELKEVGTEHILVSIMKDVDCLGARLLHTMDINMPELYKRLMDVMGISDERARDFFKNTRSAGEESDTSEGGYLEQFGRDLTQMAREGKLDPIVGRERETERVLQILCRKTKNNPCLIGEPGVGKTAIVEGLAQKMARGDVPPHLAGKRIVTLDMAGMVAGSKYRGEFEERMKRVLGEVMDNRDTLLFIDELHTIIGAGGAEGALDASNIMKPFLSRGEIQVIGATTVGEYRKYVEKDPALERRFQPVMVEEPSVEETIRILRGLRLAYENHHGILITDEALEAAANMSKRYINDRFLPDKAIDLMDESCARASLGIHAVSEKKIRLDREYSEISLALEEALRSGDFESASTANEHLRELREQIEKEEKRNRKRLEKAKGEVKSGDIAATVALWTGIPAERISLSEGKRLLQLGELLHKRVIGQEEAVKAVAQAIRRGRAGLKDPKRPIGSFLFLGPTGVGKTELSKALAEAVFGSEQNMIRVDMSEYMEKHSVSKLVGSPPGYVGYEEGGQLSEKVRRHPYSVILFDEIEKAHPDVFNILLQVLDEGHITDSQGRKVDFRNTVLIMTSNAGAASIMNPKLLGFGAASDEQRTYDKMKSGVMEEIKRIFKPEFLNRIDDIIVFHSLTPQEIADITQLLAKELTDRCKNQLGISLHISQQVKEKIAKEAFDPKYGARPLKRAIQTQIEDPLTEEILSGRAVSGDRINVKLKDGKIEFSGSKRQK